MPILSINTQTTGLVGPKVQPRRCTMITTDDFTKVTEPGYINNENIYGVPVENTDLFDVIYSFNEQTKKGIYAKFMAVYENGTFVLQSVAETNSNNSGIAEMAEGAAVVNNPAVTANSLISYSVQSGTDQGFLTIDSLVPGEGFNIISTNIDQAGLIFYQIFEPA